MFNRFGLLFKIVIKRNRCNVRLICEPSKHIAKTAKAYPEWWWRERWKQLSSSTMRRYKNLHFNEMCTAFFVCTRSVVNGTKIGLWFVIVVSCFFLFTCGREKFPLALRLSLLLSLLERIMFVWSIFTMRWVTIHERISIFLFFVVVFHNKDISYHSARDSKTSWTNQHTKAPLNQLNIISMLVAQQKTYWLSKVHNKQSLN